ncbi:phosphatase PAP2 family protein [Butyrivibrio sp. NC3005]|uniref:phosphatase PAP2 family protein n=1 Tax=Butyrivibrio sp. NC3005 TaxID=1280685 RepID=UPI0004203907|nr:phosphatase PAP2 family protein [Butyrivibrio sp. NC3005]
MYRFIKNNIYSRPVTRQRIIKSVKMVIPTFIYGIIYCIWFNYLEKRPLIHYTEMHTRFDDKIPFLEIFVLPYAFWFVFVAFCVAFPVLCYEQEDYWRFVIFLCGGMTLFLIISTFFPTLQRLRPDLSTLGRDNIFIHMVNFFYTCDTPTNIFPSMHVYNAIGGSISIINSKRFSKKGNIISIISAILIVLSTMFIKQHSVIDVICGIGLAVVFYYLVYRTNIVIGFLRILGFINDNIDDKIEEETPFVTSRNVR